MNDCSLDHNDDGNFNEWGKCKECGVRFEEAGHFAISDLREAKALIVELTKERDMYKAQVATFRKNAPKMMRRDEDGELVPLDKQAVGVTLPALLDALGAKLAGRDITAMVDELDKARDLTDVQKYVLSFLKGPGDGGGVGDIGVMLKSMLAKVPTEGEISHEKIRPEGTGRLGEAGAGADADSVDSPDTAVPDREAVPADNRAGNEHDN